MMKFISFLFTLLLLASWHQKGVALGNHIGIVVNYGPRDIFYKYTLGQKDLRYHPKFNQFVQLLQANTRHNRP